MRPTPFMGERHDILTIDLPSGSMGTPLIWNPPGNRVVQVVGIMAMFSTSAAVQDRHVRVYVNNAAGLQVPFTPAMTVQTENLDWAYYFTLGIAPLDMSADLEVFQPLGCCYQIQGGSTAESLRLDATNFDALDRFTDAKVRYFVWEQG